MARVGFVGQGVLDDLPGFHYHCAYVGASLHENFCVLGLSGKPG